MEPVVVIEVDAGEADASEVEALLASCKLGMHGRARCVLVPAPTGSETVAQVVVTWETPEKALASVAVGRAPEPGARRRVRELGFSELDPPIERWRATGFAIATAVGDVMAEEEAAVAETEDPRAGSASESPAVGPRRQSVRWWFDGRFAASTGAQSSPAALGGGLVATRLIDRWFLSGALGLSSQSAHGTDLLRAGASIGGGIVAPEVWEHMTFALRLEPRIEYIDASAQDARGATGHGGRWAFGVGQALEAAWMPTPSFGLVCGLELRELTQPVAIQEHGDVVALVPGFDFAIEAGLRYGLP